MGELSLMAICTTYMTHLYAQGADYLRILHTEEIIGLNEKCNSVATLRFFTVSLRAMSTRSLERGHCSGSASLSSMTPCLIS